MQQHFHTEALARQTIRDHAAILAAIAAGNSDRARTAMHRHIGRVAREFQRGVTIPPETKDAPEKAGAGKRGTRATARA